MRNRLTKKPKAMRELTLPGCDVKKANELVRSRISITDALGSRVLASLIACVRSDDTEFRDVYEIPVKDFISHSDGRSYTEIKKVCRELLSAYAELETKTDGKPTYTGYSFFDKIEYSNGIIQARFSSSISPMLLGLRGCFTKYNLIEYLKLPSIYSQRIFEILKSWGDKPEVTIPLTDLHKSLTSPASFRANFAEFRRRVLDKAHKDITEKTALRYEWESIKKGRGIVAVRFIFAPGRKAIAAASSQAKEQEKISAANRKAFLAAIECAKGKSGQCAKQDNKKSVCLLCRKQGICQELAHRLA